MKILVDSNILLRLAHTTDPQHQVAMDATTGLLHKKEDLFMVPQNLYEFWAVATRPLGVNGLGFTVLQVQNEIGKLRRILILLDETPHVYGQWENLVGAHAVVGKNAHDTHLVAAMVVHGISHLLTFNKQDFQRFTNITVMTPAEVMAIP